MADKIKIGVCAREKKVNSSLFSFVSSAPMGQILERLQAFGEFEVWFLVLDLQFDTVILGQCVLVKTSRGC
ncbi:hypothetical protein MUK42_36373 [Musa troglodytarum]|uniref:Uncharacterized protein n=1 Tax=Musa troglodytarum TaxID=320322 RepID=A0A9E7FHE7_9LILI|nr:hypothetical protein MUK42_36373 [Musa troglodytarum]